MPKNIEHNRTNVERLVELLDDMGVVEDKDTLIEELIEDKDEFNNLYDENYEPSYWGHFDDEDYLPDEDISEMDEPPGLRF